MESNRIFIFMCIIMTCNNQYGSASIEKLLLQGSQYSYSATNSPETWASTFEFCGGSSQSPIDLDTCDQLTLPALQFSGHWDFRPEGFTLHNTGHYAEVVYSGIAPTLEGGLLRGEYTLEQVHFHWGVADQGSEHQIDGFFYGMEAHLVHYKTEYGSVTNASDYLDGLSVVGLMFEVSDTDNADIDMIVDNLGSVLEEETSVQLPSGTMSWLEKHLVTSGAYYTYHGSLTTPPCYEDVVWVVPKTSAPVARQQIAKFRQLLSAEGPILENTRPLQPLNKRHVFCSV